MLLRFSVLAILLLAALLPLRAIFAMSSTNFEIRFGAIGAGGGNAGSSATYQLRDTVGIVSGAPGVSATYDLRSGYRGGIYDPVATFSVFGQDRSSQVAVTALVGTVATLSNTTGFTVGEKMLIVQNQGSAQNSAIGEITNVAGNDVTIDFLTHSGTTPTIDGVNDYAYVLDSTSISLGNMSSSAVATAAIGWEVNADVDEGYQVFLYENNNLQNGSAQSIADVTDGTVTAGASEYGAKSSDTTLAGSTFDTADTAILSSAQLVGSRTSNAFKSRDFLTLKAAVSGGHASGSFSHTLTLIYAGDY